MKTESSAGPAAISMIELYMFLACIYEFMCFDFVLIGELSL